MSPLRLVCLLAVILGGASCLLSQPPPVPPAVNEADQIARLALAHQLSLPSGEARHIRFLSWHMHTAEEAEKRMLLLSFLAAHTTFAKTPPPFRPLEGTGGKLTAFDLRHYRWNSAAWSAVAQRDRYMVEPVISSAVAQSLRLNAGERLDETEAAKNHHYPVLAIISGDQLLRDLMETSRTSTYYDLLFGDQRYKEEVKVVKKSHRHPGGDLVHPVTRAVTRSVPAGEYWYDVEVRGAVKFADFPKDEKDWYDAFGVNFTRDFYKKIKLAYDQGAVAPGADNDVAGSIVAKQDRLLVFEKGLLGVVMQSHDFIRNTGKADPVEHGPDFADGVINADAHEYIFGLPSGGVAFFLTDKGRKRIERGDTEVVRNTLDHRFVDVRNMMGCIVCHAPDNGVIHPRNLVEELIKDGVDLKVKDPARLQRYTEFFLSWDGQIEEWRLPYQRMLARLPRAKGGKVRTGAEMVKLLLEVRDGYDRPVTLAQAALELGVPADKTKIALGILATPVRLNWLVLGRPVPRVAWETELYLEAGKYVHQDAWRLLEPRR